MKKLTEMRNRDLTEASRRCAQLARQRGQRLTLGELMAAAAACRPKLHYIEYETASRRLKQIERKGLEACVRPGPARQQWKELAEQVAEAQAARRKLSFSQALTFVLHFRRPSRFYLTPASVFKIIRPHFTSVLVEYNINNHIS